MVDGAVRPRISWAAAPLAVLAAVAIHGCGPADEHLEPNVRATVHGPHDPTASASTAPRPARAGTPAPSQRVRFVPSRVVLPGGVAAPVDPASTRDGLLVVPRDVARVGWWDGGAQAGDPYGSLVLAGHVDDDAGRRGFFARLPGLAVGDRVVVQSSAHSAAYTVARVRAVSRDALATRTRVFGQTSRHRLVLITCTGAFEPLEGGYQQNLVVVAYPDGPAKSLSAASTARPRGESR